MLKTFIKSFLNKPFEYSPLSSERSIRVVNLHNALVMPVDSERIELTIEERSLDSPGEYWALSYVCGDTRPVTDIRVNGGFFGIGQNLHIALRHAWLHFSSTIGGALWEDPKSPVNMDSPKQFYLWIDAICISQSDNAEKSRQVKQMTEIFAKSQRVLCWLGEEDETFRVGYSKLKQITQWYDEEARRLGGIGVNTHVINNVRDSGLLFDVNGDLDLAPWEALGKFFKRPYWDRTWIVQECTTQATTTYICGYVGISSRTLLIAMTVFLGCMMQGGFERLESITGLEEVLRRNNLKETRMRKPEEMTLLKTVDMMRKYMATDPRDKIYACVGVANDGAQLRVDYGLSVIEVYMDFVKFELEKGTLNVLGFVGKSINPPAGLPSWVPDWTTYVRRAPFPKWIEGQSNAGKEPVYHADPFFPSEAPAWEIDFGTRQLISKGVFVDRIEMVGEPANHGLSDVRAERSWAPSDSHAIYEPTQETKLRAYFRILIADTVERNSEVISRASEIEWPDDLEPDAGLLHITSRAASVDGRPFSSIKSITTMRRYLVTESGYMGLVPSYAKKGDEIWALAGGQVLYALRDTGRRDKSSQQRILEFLGETYIHGLMDGEIADQNRRFEQVLME